MIIYSNYNIVMIMPIVMIIIKPGMLKFKLHCQFENAKTQKTFTFLKNFFFLKMKMNEKKNHVMQWRGFGVCMAEPNQMSRYL